MKINKILPEHIERLEKKFNYFENNLERNEPAFVYLKSDPSLFSYYFFSNQYFGTAGGDSKGLNRDRFKVFPFQDLVLNDEGKRILLVIARQTGKSTIAALRAIHKAYWNDNFLVLIISSTKDQAKELIHRMSVFLNTSKFTLCDIQESKSEIKIQNPNKRTWSRVISVPATDAARGYSPNEVILDEADFIENGEYFFKNVVLPSVQNTKGSICIYTTPNPRKRGGFVFEAANQEDIWSIYQFDWKANPNTTIQEIDQVKQMMSIDEFSCEYEAKFPSGELSFFKEVLVKEAMSDDCGLGGTYPPGSNLICGVDFAKVNDQSIFYIGYIENPKDHPNAQIVKVWRSVVKPIGTDYTAVLSEIKDLRNKYGVTKFYIDATGVGEVPADILKSEGIPVEPIKFSLQSKAEIYHNLKFLFEQKRIKIPNDRKLYEELIMMEHEYLAYDKLKIHHPEGGHDDHADSLALMCYGLVRDYKPSGITIIRPSSDNKEGNEKVLTNKTHMCEKCKEYFTFPAEKHFSLKICQKCE